MVDLMNELNSNLVYLNAGQTLDVPGLTQSEAKAIKNDYSTQYVVRGPVEEKEGSGRFVINIQARGATQNA